MIMMRNLAQLLSEAVLMKRFSYFRMLFEKTDDS